jgi:hypothetical protein
MTRKNATYQILGLQLILAEACNTDSIYSSLHFQFDKLVFMKSLTTAFTDVETTLTVNLLLCPLLPLFVTCRPHA